MAYIGKSPTGSGVRTRYYYTATGGETSISGADDNGRTLSFTDAEYVDVYMNGVLLVHGTDYGTGTANTISSLAALSSGDIIEIVVYDIYTVAKINSEAARRRYYYTATGGETSVSGADDNGQTITFAANSEIEVNVNGISIVQGSDFNTSAANTVGGLATLTAGQVVEIVVYERFVLTDTVSKRDGGTFNNNIVVDGNITTTGNIGAGVSNPNSFFSGGNQLVVGDGSGAQGLTVYADSASHGQILFADGTSGNEQYRGIVRYDHVTDSMQIMTSGASERLRILSTGGITFNGDTSTANALDDYEEGTWTPAFQNVATPTYTEQTGIYTKIGRLVHLYIKLNYSGLDTSDASSLAINLPYTASAGGAFHLIQSTSSTGYTGTNTLSLIGSVGISSTVITFGSNTSYDDGDYDSGNFAASGILHFAGVYITS